MKHLVLRFALIAPLTLLIAPSSIGQTLEQLPLGGFAASPYPAAIVTGDGESALIMAADDLNDEWDCPVWGIHVLQLTDGTLTRVDLDEAGRPPRFEPSLFGCPDHAPLAISRGGRFVAFRSSSTTFDEAASNGEATLYWLDRDADNDGILDEIDGRRLRAIRTTSRANRADLSDDGRYLVFEDQASFGDLTVRLVDLDGDGDGTLGELDDVRFVPLDSLLKTMHGTFTLESPSISGDGRFIAFEAERFIGVGSSSQAEHDVYRHDRDDNRDGIFDQPNGVATLRLTGDWTHADVGSGAIPQISRDGDHVTFLAKHSVAGKPSGAGESFLYAHQISTGKTTELAPADHGLFAASAPLSISTHGDVVTFVEQARYTPSLALTARRIDRDADGDGVFDEPGSVTIDNLNQRVAGSGATTSTEASMDDSGDIVLFHRVPKTVSPIPSLGLYVADFACETAVIQLSNSTCLPPLTKLSVIGCLAAGSPFWIEVGSGGNPSTAFVFFSDSSQLTSVGACGSILAAPWPALLPIPLSASSYGVRGVAAGILPNTPFSASFAVQGIVPSPVSPTGFGLTNAIYLQP